MTPENEARLLKPDSPNPDISNLNAPVSTSSFQNKESWINDDYKSNIVFKKIPPTVPVKPSHLKCSPKLSQPINDPEISRRFSKLQVLTSKSCKNSLEQIEDNKSIVEKQVEVPPKVPPRPNFFNPSIETQSFALTNESHQNSATCLWNLSSEDFVNSSNYSLSHSSSKTISNGSFDELCPHQVVDQNTGKLAKNCNSKSKNNFQTEKLNQQQVGPVKRTQERSPSLSSFLAAPVRVQILDDEIGVFTTPPVLEGIGLKVDASILSCHHGATDGGVSSYAEISSQSISRIRCLSIIPFYENRLFKPRVFFICESTISVYDLISGSLLATARTGIDCAVSCVALNSTSVMLGMQSGSIQLCQFDHSLKMTKIHSGTNGIDIKDVICLVDPSRIRTQNDGGLDSGTFSSASNSIYSNKNIQTNNVEKVAYQPVKSKQMSKPQSCIQSRIGKPRTTRRVMRHLLMDEKNLYLWAVDDGGFLFIYDLHQLTNGRPKISFDLKINVQHAVLTDRGHLWVVESGSSGGIYGTAKYIYAYKLHTSGEFFQLKNASSSLVITSLASFGDRVVTGHEDGSISIWAITEDEMAVECVLRVMVNPGQQINAILWRGKSLLWVGSGGFYTGAKGTLTIVDPYNFNIILEWQDNFKSVSLISELSQTFNINTPNHQNRAGEFLGDALKSTDKIRENIDMSETEPTIFPVITIFDGGRVSIWDGKIRQCLVNRELKIQVDSYTCKKYLDVRVCSWNVSGCRPFVEPGFIKAWVGCNHPCRGEKSLLNSPDLIIFGLQEIVELDDAVGAARSIIKSSIDGQQSTDSVKSQAIAEEWTRIILREIGECGFDQKYIAISKSYMVGLCMIILGSEGLTKSLYVTDEERVMTGLGGRYGNKGALVTRLIVFDSTLCIINAHLTSGQNASNARESDLAKVFTDAKLSRVPVDPEKVLLRGDSDGSSINEQETCIILGDLNYRLCLDRARADQEILNLHAMKTHSSYESLIKNYDQLTQCRRRTPRHPLRSFIEGSISFPPTYKYDPQSDEYDTGEKQRVPSYCDRILIRGPSTYRGEGKLSNRSKNNIECRITDTENFTTNFDGIRIETYGAVQSQRRSDHRPVYAQMTVPVRLIDRGKRDALQAKLIDLQGSPGTR